jgi:cytochrome c biogenesis protein CcmG/thiol:disulfide interchange protein DsbE
LDRYGITYPNAPDIGSRAFEDYRCTGVPETFFIDRDGVIQHVQIGPLTQPRLYALLDQLLVTDTQN